MNKRGMTVIQVLEPAPHPEGGTGYQLTRQWYKPCADLRDFSKQGYRKPPRFAFYQVRDACNRMQAALDVLENLPQHQRESEEAYVRRLRSLRDQLS